MPQMMPMWWSVLSLSTCLIFLFLVSVVFFWLISTPQSSGKVKPSLNTWL